MKKILLVVGILSSTAAMASDIETAYIRFDALRGSDASAVEKAYGAFEYIAEISRDGVAPASIEGCLRSIKVGVDFADPCMPISAVVRDPGTGGGTGGVD